MSDSLRFTDSSGLQRDYGEIYVNIGLYPVINRRLLAPTDILSCELANLDQIEMLWVVHWLNDLDNTGNEQTLGYGLKVYSGFLNGDIITRDIGNNRFNVSFEFVGTEVE